MTVKELIEFLETQPQGIQVAYQCFSESMLLNPSDVSVVGACEPRPDGWVANERPDKLSMPYLLFPGN